MSEFIKDRIENMTKEEMVAYLSALDDIKTQEQINPLTRFRHNNEKQQEFLKFTKPFQFFIGGNKAGKTGTMTYKAINIILGNNPKFPHEPPLTVWVCGETRPVLDDTITKQLKKWLREDQYKIVKVGQFIEKMYVKDDKGRTSELIYKPYSGGVDIFESANVHLVVADEEMPEEIFSALPPRLVENSAWYMQAMTPTHGITYVKDMIEGTGKYAGFKEKDFIDYVITSIYDNKMNLPPEAIEMMEAAFAHDPTMRKIRMLGQFESFEGKVYEFKEQNVNEKGESENWHVFDLHELPDLDKCKFFGMLDYGRGDEFVYVLIALDEDDTFWFLDEVYQSGLEADEQAKLIEEMSERWEAKPEMIVADRQIKDKMAQGGSILNIYLDELGEGFTAWRTLERDKRSPETARAQIGRRFQPNPVTGKPFYRFSAPYCRSCIKELKTLQWAKGGTNEKTSGKDHAEAALRYFTRADITFENYMTVSEIEARDKVKPKYKSKLNQYYQF